MDAVEQSARSTDQAAGFRIGRRGFASGLVLAGMALGGDPAEACSLVARRIHVRFDRDECRRQMAGFVDLLNQGHGLSSGELEERASQYNLDVESRFAPGDTPRNDIAGIARQFLAHDGHRDTKPARIAEMNLIRRRDRDAAFGVTLWRYRYFPADLEGCNGLGAHDEYWGESSAGFVASFYENRLVRLRDFDEWFV